MSHRHSLNFLNCKISIILSKAVGSTYNKLEKYTNVKAFTMFRLCKGFSLWERSREKLKGKYEKNDVSSNSPKPAPSASGKTSHWMNKGVHETNAQ